jgi:hypothetical protein
LELSAINADVQSLGRCNRDANPSVPCFVPQKMSDIAGEGTNVHGSRRGVLGGQHLQRVNRRFFVAADRLSGEGAGFLHPRQIPAAGSGGASEQFERAEKRL